MKIKLRHTVWLFAVVFLLTGCGEVLNEYYISNHGDAAVTIIITPYLIETAELTSGPLIQDIESSVRQELERPLAYELVADTIQFDLPPNTTVYLGSSSGGNDLFSQLVIGSGDQEITMTENDYHDYFALHDKFVGPIVHIYAYEADGE